MSGLPPGGLEVAVDVAQIASRFGRVEPRADALLEALRRVIPFQAAGIFLLGDLARRPVPVASRGYDHAVSGYITSQANAEEVELLGFTRARLPLRVQDLPVPRDEIRGWTDYLRPAGFREGMAVGLFTPDGRYVGFLGLNTDSARYPTEAARDLVGALAPVIASAVDPLRSAIRMAGVVTGATAGIVLTRTGETLPLPGLRGHTLLREDSRVVDAVAGRAADTGFLTAFLCPDPARHGSENHVRITVLECPPDSPLDLVAVILVSPPGDIRGLTRRELEILGLVVEGFSNRLISAELFITLRTVNAHLEHILAKLGAPTRTLAAARAFRFGLYVPPALSGIPDQGSR